MLLLHILNGKKAGCQFSARRFPVHVGRSASADLALEEPGVWDDHFEISATPEGLILKTHPQAPVMINDQAVSQARLRNGDRISIGALNLRFELAPALQRNPQIWEWLTWTGLGALCVGEVAVIYWLMAL